MAVIKKYLFAEDLEKYSVLIQDTDPNSKYFKITELPNVFTGGKNAFLIQGSGYLVPDTLIKIEIKDSQGKVIYHEVGQGTPEYYEGTSKIVGVYVYPDTAYGPCTITILGELKYYDNNGVKTPIPVNWEGQYNCRWQAKVNVNPQLNNTTKVRFYRRPKIQITENILPIYVYSSGSIQTYNGFVSGAIEFPSDGLDPTSVKIAPPFQVQTKLTPTDGSSFTPDMSGSKINLLVQWPSASAAVGARIAGQNWVPVDFTSGSQLNSFAYDTDLKVMTYSSSAEISINGALFITASGWVDTGLFRNFETASMQFSYTQSAGYISSGVDSSFANIKLTDLETFTGDAVRLKIYGRSRNDLGDYTLLEDITLESDELLEIPSFNNQLNVRTGVFNNLIINSFWKIKNVQTGATTQFGNTRLSGSVKLIPNTDANSSGGLFTFYSSQSIDFTKETEYALDFTPLLSASVSNYGKLEVYISGSSANTIGKPNSFGQLVHSVEANESYRKFEKQQINFKPENNGSGSLLFLVKSGTWELQDISLRAAQESSFSPNEFSINLNLPVKVQNEIFDFKFELYDINNNYIPVKLEASQSFVGGSDLRIPKTLRLNPSDTIFNFRGTGSAASNGTASVFPSEIIIDVEKLALTGSITFISSAVDLTGSLITGTPTPGNLITLIPEKKYKLTYDNFTGSLLNTTVGAITYTASCEGLERYLTIFKVSDGDNGPTGPGIVMRGVWSSSVNYSGSDSTTSRKDAVIYPDPAISNGPTQFFLAKESTGPGTPIGAQAPDGTPGDTAYWQYLGNEQMFVAAQIAIFRESYVKNTINIGTNNQGGYDAANITLYGGNNFPYMSIGQTIPGQYSSGGIFLGNDSGSYKMSLVGTGGSLLWNGTTLTISGSVSAIDGNIGGWIISSSQITNNTGRLRLNPFTPGLEIYDTSSVKRVDVRFGDLTSDVSTTISINPPSVAVLSATYGGYSIPEDNLPIQTFSSTVGYINIANPGTYRGTYTAPGTGIVLTTDGNFDFSSYFRISRGFKIFNPSGQVIDDELINTYFTQLSYDSYAFPSTTKDISITFPTAGTYTIKSYWERDYYMGTYPPFYNVAATATITNRVLSVTGFTVDLENNITELTDKGMQIISSTSKYVKFPRTNSNQVVDIKGMSVFTGNSTTDPAISVTNTTGAGSTGISINTNGNAITVTNGNIQSNFTNGWIGSSGVTNAIRIGAEGGFSRIAVQNFIKASTAGNSVKVRSASVLGLGAVSAGELYEGTSTIAVKKDIEDYPNTVWESIKKIRPVLYTPLIVSEGIWNSSEEVDYDEEFPGIQNAKEYIGKMGGFIAEWLDNDPEMRRYVVYEPSGSVARPKSLDYERLVVPLTKAVQMLIQKVEMLEAKLSGSV